MGDTPRSWARSSRRNRADAPLPRLLVADDVLVFVRHTAAASPDRETGGILMGPPAPHGQVIVTHASGPGPRATRSSGHFLRDTAYCRDRLRDHHDRLGIDYVGEWHSHVFDLPRPSPGDVLTLAGIMADPDYDFVVFGMLLAVVSGPIVELHGFAMTPSALHRVPVETYVPREDASGEVSPR